ncbi:MAG: hypothetical protein NT091_03535 [Candidatus Falkowbacteria bacterium]|nr:hypothetical protein [Candidatus Falkowbacteria bacterium]
MTRILNGDGFIVTAYIIRKSKRKEKNIWKKITLKVNKNNKLKVFIDPLGNTLNLWWGDPKDSCSAVESQKTGDVIALNKNGQAIGLEKIGFFPKEIDPLLITKDVKKLLTKNNFSPLL